LGFGVVKIAVSEGFLYRLEEGHIASLAILLQRHTRGMGEKIMDTLDIFSGYDYSKLTSQS
jgi:hypothetical protein